MAVNLSEQQQKTLMELQRRGAELSTKKSQLKAQQQALSLDYRAADTTLRYLQEQKEDTNIYFSIGRMFIKHSITGAKQGLGEGLKTLKTDLDGIEKGISALDSQLQSSQLNLIEFLKSNNIPFQQR